MRGEGIGLVVALFMIVGLGVGVVGITTTSWAEAAFATEAGGDAERFGPIFVAQLYLAVTAAALLAAPLLAGVLGVLVGSRSYDVREAATTCGIGSGVGALGYGGLVVAFVVGSQGAAADQAYAALDALGPVLATAVGSAIVGGVAGVLGGWAG